MKKRIKQVIGVIIGIIIGISTTVGATTIFNSKDITYSSDKTSKTNVKDSLDELYNKAGKCPEGQYCFGKSMPLSIVEVGDYISMTPTSTSYTPPGELTGCMNDANCTQNTLNPSELNLWRVIKKNEDGTVDAVSEYVSSKLVYFYGKVGYMNYVGALNTISAQYTNEKYIQRARYIGYSTQELNCSSFSSSVCYADEGYKIDLELVNIAYGNDGSCTTNCSGLKASQPGNERGDYYFVGSRWSAGTCLGGFRVNDGGTLMGNGCLVGTNDKDGRIEDRLRPIVTIRSDVHIKSGDGKNVSTAYRFE